MEYSKTIDSFLTFQFTPHKLFRLRTGYYWIKNNEVIVEFWNQLFFVRWDIIESICTMFSIEYDDAQKLIKNWLDIHYKKFSVSDYTDIQQFDVEIDISQFNIR
jgi:hypothetical protein